MEKKRKNWPGQKNTALQFAYFLLMLGLGLAVFLLGGYLGTIPVGIRTWIKVINMLALGMFTLACSRAAVLKPWFPVIQGFFLGSAGLLLVWIFKDWPLNELALNPDAPQGWATAKLLEALAMVLPALVWLRFSGQRYSDVYLGGGRSQLSLLLRLGMCALIGLVYGTSSAVFSRFSSVIPVLGSILTFSAANGFTEELLLRGLLLRPFETFFSPTLSLLLSTMIFTGMHFGAGYVERENLATLLAFTFLLGLGNGAIMQRSQSIIGAVLAHFFADSLLLVSVFGAFG